MSIALPTPPSTASSVHHETTVGNYFVSNYPPFSFWKPERRDEAAAALDRAPQTGTPLGLYLHIPFCRKRCHFCYFRVYTDKDSTAINGYLNLAMRELELYAAHPFIGGRKPQFVYFGGGTPSYLSEVAASATWRTDEGACCRGTRPRRSRLSASPARSPTTSSRRSGRLASRG